MARKKKARQNLPKDASGGGPRRPTKAERKAQLDAQLEAERREFDRRKRHQLAKAAIELDQTDILIFEHSTLRPWLTQEQIGDLVGLERHAVSDRMNAPKFLRAVAEAGRSALEIFQSNQAKAARKLAKLLDDPDSRIAIRAAVAHMWPHIHGDADGATDNDFVRLLQDAYAEAEKKRAAPEAGEGTKSA